MASNAAKEAARQRVAEHAEEVVTGAVFQELAPQSRPAADPRRAAKRKRPATRDPEEEAVQVWRDETRRRLEEPMDYSKIQTRAGPGGHKLHYMPSDAVISLANAYFGFDGWSCEVKASEIDAVSQCARAAVSLPDGAAVQTDGAIAAPADGEDWQGVQRGLQRSDARHGEPAARLRVKPCERQANARDTSL